MAEHEPQPMRGTNGDGQPKDPIRFTDWSEDTVEVVPRQVEDSPPPEPELVSEELMRSWIIAAAYGRPGPPPRTPTEARVQAGIARDVARILRQGDGVEIPG